MKEDFSGEMDSDQRSQNSQKSDEDDEQDRWCSICQEDAVVWCVDCDHEPYCRRCWREGHVDDDLRGHRTVPVVHGGRKPR